MGTLATWFLTALSNAACPVGRVGAGTEAIAAVAVLERGMLVGAAGTDLQRTDGCLMNIIASRVDLPVEEKTSNVISS